MNLLITADCNLDCPYCFAVSLRKRLGGKEMTLPELETVLTAMGPERSPVRLMGGEPTLHSK
jgi:molybdenum cofactor biosynthesis enzyme MoaA